MFSNNHSKSTGSPLREAEVKAVKVVNFVAMWLNLYPHTVDSSLNSAFSRGAIHFCRLYHLITKSEKTKEGP